MRNKNNYQDQIQDLYSYAKESKKLSRNVTLQVTDRCDMFCSYCYMLKKGNTNMTRETAKRIIDMLFDMWERDDPNEYIDKSTKAIVLDFIGGEPLLNIDVIDYACDYFWNRALELRSPWADTWRASMISNGTQYFNPKVQSFIRKYADKLSFGITIDGDKEMHDSCRKHHDGRGNFEEAHAAQKHFHETYPSILSTKVTIAPENLDKLHNTVKYFIENGYSQINANTIYEAEWTLEQAQVYYEQLKQISDYLIDNNIDVPVSLFSEWAFKPLPESENQNWCGSSGKMLAFDPNGNAFPCIRFMESSLNGSQKPMCIGDCIRGIYKTDEEKSTLEMLESMTRRSQSTDECFCCPIAAGCAWCNGWQYQKFGTPDKRDTASCIMHKARSLANVYYWNKKYRKDNSEKRFKMYLPKDDAIEIVGTDEYNLLSSLESQE